MNSLTKPRVVLLGPSSERYKGGIAQFTSRLAEELGIRTELRFISWYKMYPPFLISRDFHDSVSQTTVSNMKADFMLGYANPLSWIKFVLAIRSFDPEFIVFTWSHAVHAPVYLFMQFLMRNRDVRFICHNVLPHEHFLGVKILTRLCFMQTHRLIVHGLSEETKMHDLLGRDGNVTRLFLPLHNFFGERIPKTTSGRTMLFFGTIRKYKGLDVLLKAMPLVLQKIPDAKLIIAGEMFYLEDIEKDDELINPLSLIKKLAISNSVEMDIRYIPNEDIPHLMSRADVCIFPFRSVSQSGAITVAFSYGVPVISTRIGGIPDVVLEGVSGILVKPDEPEELAAAIIGFFNNPIPSGSVVEFSNRLSWKRYVDGLISGETVELDKT